MIFTSNKGNAQRETISTKLLQYQEALLSHTNHTYRKEDTQRTMNDPLNPFLPGNLLGEETIGQPGRLIVYHHHHHHHHHHQI